MLAIFLTAFKAVPIGACAHGVEHLAYGMTLIRRAGHIFNGGYTLVLPQVAKPTKNKPHQCDRARDSSHSREFLPRQN